MSKPPTFTGWVMINPKKQPRAWTVDATRKESIIRFESEVGARFRNFRDAFNQGWRCKKFTARVNTKPKTKKP